jgi:multidrug efflux pump subunit AcrA (membrane-fusion protein)
MKPITNNFSQTERAAIKLIRSVIKTTPAILLMASLVACNNQQSNVSTEIAVPVSVTDIKPGSIEKVVNTTGTVVASKETSLSTQTSGNYHLLNNPRTGRPFALGDMVEAGQVIIRLEDAEYENGIAIESKKLSLEISEQELKKQQSLYEKGARYPVGIPKLRSIVHQRQI